MSLDVEVVFRVNYGDGMNVRCAYRAGTPGRVLGYARVCEDADARRVGN